MKLICVNQNKFTKVIGYGGWGLLTFGLLFYYVVGEIEISNGYHEPESGYYSLCYKSIISDIEDCRLNYYGKQNQQYLNLIGILANFVIVGIWIYFKQQKFRFSWCLKDGSESK